MYGLMRSLLFTLPTETSHQVAMGSLDLAQRLHLQGLLGGARAGTGVSVKVMGIDFPNVLGLSAGLDKNADHIDGLAALGFGFIEIGTLTPRPQPGNPLPRLFRLPEQQAIINRMGFNNKGMDYALAKIRSSRFNGVLGINIGKNFDTPVEKAADDYLIGLRKAWELASYVVVNLSSPNTPGLR
ncbi:MAG: dihydroorotate dehydrogenase (quinone), partial [Pseudohongiella sp.]|nr:dihydroorotate dehydrogenase (quinone) [Pseudohongiella sp.]